MIHRSIVCLPLLLVLSVQDPVAPKPMVRPELTGVLDFEAEHTGGVPKGWAGGPPGTIAVDGETVHGGRWSVRIDRKADSPGNFTSVTKIVPIDFAGTTLELRGFLRTESVSGFAALWMRQDADSGPVAFDNMEGRQLKGSSEWREYSVVLPLNSSAKRLAFGVLASGAGRVWADDLRLLVDGKPIVDVPRVEPAKTVLDLDTQFDTGSGIVLKNLTALQIANLTLLGKVWGFLKYHHPAVAAGKRHWDYDLFRIVPKVLAASDGRAARAVLHEWVTGLGPVSRCRPCASLTDAALHLPPRVAWLTDEMLGSELAAALRGVHQNRLAGKQQFYVSLVPNVGNPSFEHELAYADLKLPDAGYQLLALFRFWNIIEYWFPYRDLIEGNWDDQLTAFIPRIALASESDAYKREMMALIATVHDTHANLWSSLAVRPPVGSCQIPVLLRFIENQAVVTGFWNAELGAATGLEVGDIVTTLEGIPVSDLVNRWSPYYAASNQPARLRDIGRSMTRGECRTTAVRVTRASQGLDLKPARVPESALSAVPRTNDHAGDTFRKLAADVAYLKLSSVKASEAAAYINAAAGTRGLVIDIRNYPSEFVVFALGSFFVDRPTAFARFTNADPANPGAFHWTPPITLQPGALRYKGKIVILVDEVSQSQAEYTAMAFRSAPGALVVGSTTAGADGNVSPIPLPGGLRSMISGIGVFYPDRKPTQQVGIIPDVEAKPTIEGIRTGRDEVLEAALRHILGPETPSAEIERLAKR